jgi:hypothetical protein
MTYEEALQEAGRAAGCEASSAAVAKALLDRTLDPEALPRAAVYRILTNAEFMRALLELMRHETYHKIFGATAARKKKPTPRGKRIAELRARADALTAKAEELRTRAAELEKDTTP